MTTPFRRHGDHVRMQLADFEVTLLRELHEALRAVLAAEDPQDPVVRRLFPAAVQGDEESDTELRGLIHDDLLQQRLEGLDLLLELLERGARRGGGVRVDLDTEEAVLVLGVLNDCRLALGAQVGIEELGRDELDPRSPVGYRVAVMDHLAGLQERLLGVLDPSSIRVHEEGEQ